MDRVAHDISWGFAQAMLDTVAHMLRQEEQNQFFGIAYEGAKAAIEAYERERNRHLHRMEPGKN